MYIPDGRHPDGVDKFEGMVAMIRDDRCLRAEEELERLLEVKKVSPATVKKTLPRTNWVSDYLSDRVKAHAATAR
jgi:hypothetical protein